MLAHNCVIVNGAPLIQKAKPLSCLLKSVKGVIIKDMSTESSPDIPGPVACHNCVAACCRRGVLITMASGEVDSHQEAMNLQLLADEQLEDIQVEIGLKTSDRNGNKLGAIPLFIMNVPARRSLHIFAKDCGYIEPDNSCAIYEDPSRPEACATVKVESDECLRARATYAPEIIARQAEHPEMLEEAVA